MAQSKESKKLPQKGDHDIWEGTPKHADEDFETEEDVPRKNKGKDELGKTSSLSS